MTDLTVKASDYDFSASHKALDRYVAEDLIAGANAAVLKGQDLIDLYTTGKADIAGGIDMGVDHIFRAYSNTKLQTSIVILSLMEDGVLGLDDPIETWLPQLGNRQVLRAGATSLADVEPAERSITIRHLLSHSSGLDYGVFDPAALTYGPYQEAGINNPEKTLSEMVDGLAEMPLLYQPGTSWTYSVATDVLGHLIEVLTGKRLGEAMRERIWEPLGMVDTDFYVPEGKRDRFTKIYLGADLMQPMLGGLTESPGLLPMNHLAPPVRQSGGGGLVSTLPDMIALMRSFLPGGKEILKPETRHMMMQNQLPEGVTVSFVGLGKVDGLGYGLGGAVKFAPGAGDPPVAVGEFQWGGVAGTHWWINPTLGIAALNMAQREMGFWHPFSAEHKAAVYAAMT